jgi:hypothetical protein
LVAGPDEFTGPAFDFNKLVINTASLKKHGGNAGGSKDGSRTGLRALH